MAKMISLETFTDKRGNLTVIDKVLPFTIKRVFFIYGVDESMRGGHRHKKTTQAAVCIQGSCKIYSTDGESGSEYNLDSPEKCLLIDPTDWHTMSDFSRDSILMVFASDNYDEQDYIFEKYSTI
jgi:dTDP-4-dehydrorhamnose 3,5-epimerase-like enzyme